jgi:CDP-diacylglycerol---serine O-phosphatidyltransferase
MAENEQQPSEETYSRFRPVPIRYLLPNLITLIALCVGITGIRLAFEGRFEIATAAVVLAIGLDAVDGRLARMLQGTSRFGAELDSLADNVNFGVAPALILYFWSLNTVRPVGWVICLMLAVACALRLARFNVMLEDPNKPAWAGNFFTGIPAPAGAALAMIPLYYGFLVGDTQGHKHAIYVAPLILAIAVMMVSRVPTFSGKNMARIPRDWVIPALALCVLVVICIFTFPWQTLLALSLLYILMIPVSVFRYWQLKRSEESSEANSSRSSEP